MKKLDPLERRLTDVEFELMSLLWALGEGTVADVMKELPDGRDLAYTSVSTILRILEQKEILKVRKQGRGHVYIPVLTKSGYEASAVTEVVDRVFEGAPVLLVKQLLDSGKVSDADLAEMKEILENFGRER
jgi:predicted transcriptional regulator